MNTDTPRRSPEQQQQRRRIYLRHRIPMIREEMEKIVEETKELIEKVKNSTSDPKAADGLKARERLIYLGEHRHTLRSQLQALATEQKGLPHRKTSDAGPSAPRDKGNKKSA